MDGKDFAKLIAGLEDALSYAKGQKSPGARVDRVKVDRSFITETRLNAGLTEEEFAKVTGASLGTKEAGLAKTVTRRRSSGSNKAA